MDRILPDVEPTKHDLVMNNDMATAMYITQRRIYDVLARILANMNGEDADILMKMHGTGLFATPLPSYMEADEE